MAERNGFSQIKSGFRDVEGDTSYVSVDVGGYFFQDEDEGFFLAVRVGAKNPERN